MFTDLVRNVVIPLVLHAQDRWLNSIACTLLGENKQSIMVFDPPLFDNTFDLDDALNESSGVLSSPLHKSSKFDTSFGLPNKVINGFTSPKH